MTNPPRFQFRLSSLLAVVTLCAIVLAAAKTLGFGLFLGFSGLVWSCGFVLLLALALIPFDSAISRLSDWNSFVFTAILFCGLDFAFLLFDAAVNHPHRFYAHFNREWLVEAAARAAWAAPLAAIFLLIPVILHLESRESGPKDRAYYPRLVNVWRGLGLLHVRLILMIGVLLVVAYYAATEIQVWSAEWSFSRTTFPGPRVWISCHLLWGLLWLADCASRPDRGMMKVAIGYLCIVVVFLLLF